MGLNSDNREKTTFLNIVAGKFAKRVSEDTPNAIERQIEYEGVKRMIWETHHRSIDAVIEGIEIKDTKFGEQLNIHMIDVADKFTISMGLESREAKGFMQCFPNINVRQEITLEPYNYARKSDDKQMMGMGIKYKGEKENIKFFYNESNGLPTSGLPEGEKMDKDEFKILMAQQIIFLKKQTKKLIEKWFGEGAEKSNVITQTTPSAYSGSGGSGGSEEISDLPFFYSPNLFKNQI